jgi:hypothetical protein
VKTDDHGALQFADTQLLVNGRTPVFEGPVEFDETTRVEPKGAWVFDSRFDPRRKRMQCDEEFADGFVDSLLGDHGSAELGGEALGRRISHAGQDSQLARSFVDPQELALGSILVDDCCGEPTPSRVIEQEELKRKGG